MTAKVLLWVQHLMGIGHVMRAGAIASALCDRGADVCVLVGGAVVASEDFGTSDVVRLPPAKAADMPQTGIVDLDGHPLNDTWYAARRDRLMKTAQDFMPDVIVTEQYPFGRRAFEFELRPLMAWAKSNGIPLVGSVRDILVKKKKPERNRQMADTVLEFYDTVMVHGDSDVIPFDTTFPETARIRDRIVYTGYVARPQEAATHLGQDEVIVSAGGGRYGERLYKTALAARALSPLKDHTWRILVGGHAGPEMLQTLKATAADGVIVEPARADFPGLLRNAALSISQCGYNTALDVLATEVPSVMVPYTGDEETEQTLRARSFEARGLCVAIDENDLSPEVLSDAIAKALSQRSAGDAPPSINGAEASADVILRRLRSHTH